MAFGFRFRQSSGRRKQRADMPPAIHPTHQLYSAVNRALPGPCWPPLPHHAWQTHGSESVPVADQISIGELERLAHIGKQFFRNMLAPNIRHV